MSVLSTSISIVEKEVSELDELISFLTIYQAEVLIPAFKREKEASYAHVVGEFCKTEIANSAKISNCWGSILSPGTSS